MKTKQTSADPKDRDTVTPYVYTGLDDHAFHETLSGFVDKARGQVEEVGLTLYCCILPGLQDATRRFEEHSNDPEYRLDGCRGIEEYIKKIGLNPATVRKWRQRQKERMFLQALTLLPGQQRKCKHCGQEQGHDSACPSNRSPLPPTEGKILTQQCIRMAQTLVGPSVQPLAERIKKAIQMAEAICEAAQGGSYEHVRFEEPVPEAPQPPPIAGDPVPEPEPGTLEALRQTVSRMADTGEISDALERFVTELLTPVLANHPYSPTYHVSVSISRQGQYAQWSTRDRIDIGDWVEFVGGGSVRLLKLIGDGKLGLGRVIGVDELRRPRICWHDGTGWKKAYSFFENDGRVRVLYDWQAAERYLEPFNSYPKPPASTAEAQNPELQTKEEKVAAA
jgi:hypothetical protein